MLSCHPRPTSCAAQLTDHLVGNSSTPTAGSNYRLQIQAPTTGSDCRLSCSAAVGVGQGAAAAAIIPSLRHGPLQLDITASTTPSTCTNRGASARDCRRRIYCHTKIDRLSSLIPERHIPTSAPAALTRAPRRFRKLPIDWAASAA
jgi:hypothetical protein